MTTGFHIDEITSAELSNEPPKVLDFVRVKSSVVNSWGLLTTAPTSNTPAIILQLEKHGISGNFHHFTGCSSSMNKLKLSEGLEKELRSLVASTMENSILPKWSYVESGGDPELFLVGEDGELVPAFEVLPDKKDAFNKQTKAYWDGFQAELYVMPSTCLQQVTAYVKQSLRDLHKAAVEKGCKLSTASVMVVKDALLGGVDQKYVELGCSPSLNAYGELPVVVPDPRKLNLRFAGGHMHFGFFNNDLKAPESLKNVVKALDAILGVATVSLFEGFEDSRRRAFYGRAGEYRTPAHGLEYRVPSPMILCHPVIFNLVYEIARQAIGLSQSGLADAWKASERDIRTAINECDVKLARKMLEKNKKLLRALLKGVWNGWLPYVVQNAELLISSGIKDHISINLEENWKLSHEYWEDGDIRQFSTLKPL